MSETQEGQAPADEDFTDLPVRAEIRGCGLFPGATERLKTQKPGAPLQLQAEPDNPHDPCAVRVLDSAGAPIGYIERDISKWLGGALWRGETWNAVFIERFDRTNKFGTAPVGIAQISEGEPS